MFLSALVLGLLMRNGAHDASSIWQPDAAFRGQVFAACKNAGANFPSCFAEQMKAAGASPEALAFTRQIQNHGYMTAYRAIGPIGIAEAENPFRANENEALWLVNGDPVAINVDPVNKSRMNELKADEAYRAMSAQHPDASIWPGDRTSVDDVLPTEWPDGSKQFIIGYRIRAGCHACAILGESFFSFHFDKDGKFGGEHFSGFTTEYKPGDNSKRFIISGAQSQSFTLLLRSNPTTGYSWRLDSVTNGASATRVKAETGAPEKRIGQGGEDRWTVQAPNTGEAVLIFGYGRPWEKEAGDAKQVTLVLRVR
jgi:inhibitor of cysteine peptidase